MIDNMHNYPNIFTYSNPIINDKWAHSVQHIHVSLKNLHTQMSNITVNPTIISYISVPSKSLKMPSHKLSATENVYYINLRKIESHQKA